MQNIGQSTPLMIMDLHISSLGIFTRRTLMCVLCIKHQVYWVLTHNVAFYWYSDLISLSRTYSHSTLFKRLTHSWHINTCIFTTIYVLTAATFFASTWYQNLISMSFLFKNYSIVKVIICWKIRYFA